MLQACLKATVEKLSPKESVEGADTVLKGSVRTHKGFLGGKPEATRPKGRSPRGLAAEGLPKENPEVYWQMSGFCSYVWPVKSHTVTN